MSNRIPDGSNPNASTYPPRTATAQTPTITTEIKNPEKPQSKTLLDEALYKPNNIIFLVDVSSSMKDTSKLKVMQHALHYLISALRPIDKITFITYADTVKIMQEALTGNDKQILDKTVDKLKAKGLTKANKAILFSLDVTLKHYIENGNNQIILATDGKFRFYPKDQALFISKQVGKTVKLSTMAFGQEKEALKNLEEIAKIGKGNFIHIISKQTANEQLLEEIKQNSLIR